MNILDYVKNTTRTFEEMPLNPVDSLVLSQLSYARLEFAEPKPENLPDRLRTSFETSGLKKYSATGFPIPTI